MFSLTPKPTFRWPVQLTVPGESQAVSVDFLFAHKTRDELNDWLKRVYTQRDAESLAEIVRGWEGVDEPFSREALDKLVARFPAASAEIVTAYSNGLATSRAKN